MTNKYVVIIKKEKGYNIIKCPEIGIDKIIKDEKIPEGIKDLKIQKALKDETIFIISIDLELELVKRRKRFIKKTVTIPEYLNILGMRKDLNFSQILAEGLREKLKVK